MTMTRVEPDSGVLAAAASRRIETVLPENSRPSVLVGFAEALSAPEVVWSLVDAGFEVIAFARRGKRSALRHSRHVACYEISAPESDVDAAVSDLRALLKKLSLNPGNTHIFFPLDDKALFLCEKLESESGWTFAAPAREGIQLALSKKLQLQAASAAGFNVPRTIVSQSAHEIRAFASDVGFPVFLKPSDCILIRDGRVTSARTWICSNPSDLQNAIATWAEKWPLVVQTFVSGIGEGIFGLSAPEGIRAWSAHRRIRMMNPRGSGSSACASRSVPEELKPNVEALIRAAAWRGIFMIELLCDHAGKYWFVELNGRPWGSMALARRSGLEYPAWQVALATDPKSDAGKSNVAAHGVVCRNLGRELMHLLFVMKGAGPDAVGSRIGIWKTLADVARISRADTFYNWRRDDLKVWFADCYYTLHDNLFKASH